MKPEWPHSRGTSLSIICICAYKRAAIHIHRASIWAREFLKILKWHFNLHSVLLTILFFSCRGRIFLKSIFHLGLGFGIAFLPKAGICFFLGRRKSFDESNWALYYDSHFSIRFENQALFLLF